MVAGLNTKTRFRKKIKEKKQREIGRMVRSNKGTHPARYESREMRAAVAAISQTQLNKAEGRLEGMKKRRQGYEHLFPIYHIISNAKAKNRIA